MQYPIHGFNADRFFTNAQLRRIVARFGETELLEYQGARALVTPMGITPVNEIPSEFTNGESLNTWDVSLPLDLGIGVFGNQFLLYNAVKTNQLWYVNENNAEGEWRRCRSYGYREINHGDRIGFRLVELAYDDAFESRSGFAIATPIFAGGYGLTN